MTPLRIVHLAGSAQWAGGERFLLQMAERLDPRQFRMSVILPERGPLEDEMKKRHVSCAVVPLEPLGNPLPIRALKRLLQRWEADIFQGHGARSNFYARLAAGKTRCISTIHNALSDYPIPKTKRWLYAAADRVTAFRSSAVVCVAECLRDEFLKRSPAMWERTYVIPNGVDLDAFNPALYNREAARRSLGLGERWTLAVLGRLTEQKGHVVLLEALRRLKETLPPFRLLLAGDGPLKSALAARARAAGLEENVVFLGVRKDVPTILAAADVVVMPSFSEGFPYVLLEALALARPVIASRVNGVTEMLPTGEEAYLVPPRSPEKLIEALLTALWNKDDAKSRAETGRRRVLREYDLRMTLSKWETLYRELSGDLLIK